MHIESYEKMKYFVYKYIGTHHSRVLDIGSMDVNGCYKDLFPNSIYAGCDIGAGKNVDVVLKTPYELPFEKNDFDVVISGQTFEHIPMFWLTMKEITRVLCKGGYFCLIVPSFNWAEHKHPVDCYRFMPDGLRAIAEYAGLKVIEVLTYKVNDSTDCMLIARK